MQYSTSNNILGLGVVGTCLLRGPAGSSLDILINEAESYMMLAEGWLVFLFISGVIHV